MEMRAAFPWNFATSLISNSGFTRKSGANSLICLIIFVFSQKTNYRNGHPFFKMAVSYLTMISDQVPQLSLPSLPNFSLLCLEKQFFNSLLWQKDDILAIFIVLGEHFTIFLKEVGRAVALFKHTGYMTIFQWCKPMTALQVAYKSIVIEYFFVNC